MVMIIYVNNTPREFDSAAVTVTELLDALNIKGTGVAVAVGVKIIKATDRDATIVQDGDKVTIIGAAYGG